jgi:hypothetical protein
MQGLQRKMNYDYKHKCNLTPVEYTHKELYILLSKFPQKNLQRPRLLRQSNSMLHLKKIQKIEVSVIMHGNTELPVLSLP